MQEEIKLIYFDIRGLAEPVRWMLKISGMDFIDQRIPLDAWATTRKASLLSKRGSNAEQTGAGAGLRKQFVGQLPIICVGEDFVLTQPLAVLRYLARRCGFAGDTELEEARAEELSDLVYDLRLRATDYEGKAFKSATPDIVRHTVFRDFRNAPDSKEKTKMRDDFRTMYFPLYFTKFDDLLTESGGPWTGGPTLTYGDLVLANFLDIAEDLVDPSCLDEFPRLRDLKDRVFAIPEIQQWKKTQGLRAANGYVENN